jgi:hypothetical protein
MVRKSVLIVLGSALLVIIGMIAMSVRNRAEILLPSPNTDTLPHITVEDQFVKS